MCLFQKRAKPGARRITVESLQRHYGRGLDGETATRVVEKLLVELKYKTFGILVDSGKDAEEWSFIKSAMAMSPNRTVIRRVLENRKSMSSNKNQLIRFEHSQPHSGYVAP